MQRIHGQPFIRDLAVVGDKRTAALIARDGAVEWLCLPGFDDPPAFGALLDPERGGRFTLAPDEPFEASRRYVPDTNVLETTFTTAGGTVRVTDALTLAGETATPYSSLVRRIDGLGGEVRMAWRVDPRFGFGETQAELERRGEAAVFVADDLFVTVQSHGAGELRIGGGAVGGEALVGEGDTAALVLGGFHARPAELPTLDVVLDRLKATVERWERWSGWCTYDGPWRDAVMRSALALELLVDDATGAMIAAATTSLPERIGGPRNYDYRYAWVRDANLALEAMMRLSYRTQVQVSMGWLLNAIGSTAPMLQPIYRIDGSARADQTELDVAGYRGSRPVHRGNSAEGQLQLGNYGDVLDATWHYVDNGHTLDTGSRAALTSCMDFLTRVWKRPDAGLWELHDREHYTQSKLACWTALRRAIALAERGELPGSRIPRWRAAATEIREYTERNCWSERLGAWARRAGGLDELDASVLLASRGSFVDEDPARLSSTIDAIRRELGAGDGLLYRYSGMRGEEGAFVACSFWAVEALARVGRVDEAAELMDAMVGHASDVGLFSEEIDPTTGEHLGNVPQALSHLALITAAGVVHTASREGSAVGVGSGA